MYSKRCSICKKESFNPLQYTVTCSKECENKNRASLVYRKRYPEKSKLYYRKYWKRRFYNEIEYRIKHN